MARWYFEVSTIVVLVVMIVHEGEPLKCWSCHSSSPGESGCGEPFKGSPDVDGGFITDCVQTSRGLLQFLPNGTSHQSKLNPGLESYCVKLTGTSLGVQFVMRGCGSGLPNKAGSCMGSDPQNVTGGNILTCEICSGDLCNGRY